MIFGFKKIFSLITVGALLINLILPVLSSAKVYAQEVNTTPPISQDELISTPAIDQNIIQEADLTFPTNVPINSENPPVPLSVPQENIAPVEPSIIPTITPTLDIREINDPTPTATLVPPNDLPQTNDLPSTPSAVSITTTAPVWKNLENNTYETTEIVGLNKEYAAPQNDKVKVKFTILPSLPGKLTIKEVKLSEDQVRDLQAVSDTAYDITSTMENGLFQYDLTLPLPDSAKGKDVEVKSAETVSSISSAQTVDEPKEEAVDFITIKDLNHFTVFILTSPAPDTIQRILINEIAPTATTEWVEVFNNGTSPVNLAAGTGWVINNSANSPQSLSALGSIAPAGRAVFEAPSNWLSNTAPETISILNELGTTIDTVTVSLTAPGFAVDHYPLATESVGRKTDGVSEWIIFTSPSKGTANVIPIPATGLAEVGSTSPTTTFPTWYKDSNGLALDLMEAADTNGISAPIDAGNVFSSQIGFGGEGFWFSADASMSTSEGSADLIQGVEASFAPSDTAVDGLQSAFARIRIRIDVTDPGTYIVTYPYGQKTYDVVTPGTKAINDTVDIGCFGKVSCDSATTPNYSTVLTGEIGPFLTWNTFDPNSALSDPALSVGGRRYVGLGTTEHLIKGSPTGNNFFRVTGPNIGGPGVNSIQTNLFTITGRLADANAPVITLFGANPVNVNQGTVYTDAGATAIDDLGGNLTGSIEITGLPVNTATLGAKTVTYTVTDSAGRTTVATRTVNVVEAPAVDNTAPVITMIGTSPVSVVKGTPYIDAGATALDNVDGDITTSIVTTNLVNTAIIGAYTVTYNVTDTAGNPATEATRTVNVVADTIAPVITITGSNPVNILTGASYTDAGATATDNVDGSLTASIITTGLPINTVVPGNFTVTYTVTDAAGNSTAVTRTVNVVNTITGSLAGVSTINPNNGYPTWYKDSAGIALQLCLGLAGGLADPNCVLPIAAPLEPNYDPTQPIVFPTNFPGESFWYIADTDVAPAGQAGAGRVRLRYALEGAFTTAAPTVNQQIAFLRANLARIEDLVPGANYTVTHPFGQFTIHAGDALLPDGVTPNPDAGVADDGRFFRLEDGAFAAPLTDVSAASFLSAATTHISKFLKQTNPLPPVGYIGDGVTLSTIEEGPNGNFVRIDGPSIDTGNYDGDGNPNILTINHWTVAGKLADITAPVITVLGTNPVDVTQNTVYTDAGATALDDFDGNVTASIITTGLPVDTSTPGAKTVTYTVTDRAGNSTSATRTVNVADSIAAAFTAISVSLALPGSDIANNLNLVNSGNSSNFSGLYFEKSIGGIPVGRLTFTGALNLTDPVTQTFLQNLGTKLDQGNGRIALDARTSAVFAAAGATLVMYNIPAGITLSQLVIRDDTGVILDPVGIVSGFTQDPVTNNITFNTAHFTQFDIDTTAPVTSDNADGLWHNTAQTITLSCTDNISGCDKTYYTTDGSTPTESSLQGTSVVISTNETNTIKYFSADNAGNLESIKTATVKIDLSAPTGPGTPVSDQISPTNQNILGWSWTTATDVLSGIGSYFWSLLNGGTEVLSGSVANPTLSTTTDITFFADGIFTFQVRAQDNVGNFTDWVLSNPLTVIRVLPVITISNPNTNSAQSKTITASTDKGTLNMINTTGSVCDGTLSFVAYSSQTFTSEADNGKKVCYRAIDASNNTSYSLSATIAGIDKTAPIITRLGTNPVDVTVGTTYTDTGATALDNVDGDITANITTINPVNTAIIGAYTVTYNVSDLAGNPALEVIRTVNVVAAPPVPDTTVPVIEPHANIIAQATSTLGAIVIYIAPNATDNVDATAAANCTPTSGSTFALGITTVTCTKTDAAGNVATPTTFTITVQDTTAPVITRLGTSPVSVTVGTVYTDAGATALDNIDGDITANIATINPVNTAVIGSYTVTYNVSDAAANPATEVTRIINVVDAPDVTPPVFSAINASSNNSNPALAKSGDILTVSFETNESLSINPAVTIGGADMTFISLVGSTYTYNRTLDGTETASGQISINGSDLAGNQGSDNTVAFPLDFTLPTGLISINSGALYTATTAVTLNFTGVAADVTQMQLRNGTTGAFQTAIIYEATHAYTLPDTQGLRPVSVRFIDSAGNINSGVISDDITLDTIIPTDPADVSSTSHTSTTSSDNTIDMAWTLAGTLPGATDTTGGVKGYSYSFTNGATDVPDNIQDSDSAVTAVTSSALANGTWYFHLRTVDNALNWTSTVHAGPFNISVSVPPVTTDNVDGQWNRAGVGVMLTCAPANGLTCANTYYTTDGSDPTTNSLSGTSFALTTDGIYTIKYFSVDSDGNQEVIKTAVNQVKIDTTNPTDPIPASATHSLSTWSNDNTVDVTWSGASDNLSGVSGFYTEWNTSATLMNGPVAKEHEATASSETGPALSDGANHYFHIATLDNAGNWTTTSHFGPFWIDTNAPAITGLTNDANVIQSKTWTWDSTDTNAQFRSSVDQNSNGVPAGAYSNIKTATQNTGTGTYYLHVQAIDTAGNESAVVTVSAILDNRLGTITVIKDAIPDDPQDFSFRLRDTLMDESFSLDDDGDNTNDLSNTKVFADLQPGSYSLQENGVSNWVTSIICQDADNGTTIDANARTATIDLDRGENVICTFTNSLKMSISGMKFNDLNGDGTKDAGEPGLPDWTIYLDTNNNGVLDQEETSTTTDINGNYQFTDLSGGTYNIREVLQNTWTQTAPAAGKYTLTVTGNASLINKDFGNFKKALITGYKWKDLDADGIWDINEPALGGWEITLSRVTPPLVESPLGGPLSTETVELLSTATTEAETGLFNFIIDNPGQYRIGERSIADWQQTFPTDSFFDVFVTLSGEEITKDKLNRDVQFGNTPVYSVSSQGQFASTSGTSGITNSLISLGTSMITTEGNGGTNTVSIPNGTTITRVDGESFDSTQLLASTPSSSSILGLGTGVVNAGVLQWGIPNLGLQFSNPITLNIFVGTALNGQTLNVRRSVSTSGPWIDDGIVAPATCVVSNGLCSFQATKASFYVAVNTLPTATPTPTTAPDSSGSSNESTSGSSDGSNASVCTDSKPGAAPVLSVVSTGENEVTLSWTKAGDPVSYYLLAFGLFSGSLQYGNPNIGGKDVTSYTVKELSGGTPYFFRVRAGNGCAPGDYSNEVQAVPSGKQIANIIPSAFGEGILGTTTEEVQESNDGSTTKEVKGDTETVNNKKADESVLTNIFGLTNSRPVQILLFLFMIGLSAIGVRFIFRGKF